MVMRWPCAWSAFVIAHHTLTMHIQPLKAVIELKSGSSMVGLCSLYSVVCVSCR